MPNHGELIKSRDFSRDVWNRAHVSAGLAPGRINGQHNLRHYFVSQLIDGSATPKDIQTFVGHKSIKTTYDVYGHLFEPARDRARTIIDPAFSSGAYPVRTAEINLIA
jgi:integrase